MSLGECQASKIFKSEQRSHQIQNSDASGKSEGGKYSQRVALLRMISSLEEILTEHAPHCGHDTSAAHKLILHTQTNEAVSSAYQIQHLHVGGPHILQMHEIATDKVAAS